MDLKQIQNKRYDELNEEEIKLLDDTLGKFNLSIESKNKIFIRFLFGCSVKESLMWGD